MLFLVRPKPEPPPAPRPIVVVHMPTAPAAAVDRPPPAHEAAAVSRPASPSKTATAAPRPAAPHDAAVPPEPVPATAPDADPAVAAHDAQRERQAAPADDPLRSWERRVLAQLDRHKRYPAIAELKGQRDRVAVRIRVDRRGSVLARTVVSSRGYPALDSEALALVGRADPLPEPPAEVDERALDFSVYIDFDIPGRRS